MFKVLCVYVVPASLLVYWAWPCLRRNSSLPSSCPCVMAGAVEGPVLVGFGLIKWYAGMERMVAMLLGLED